MIVLKKVVNNFIIKSNSRVLSLEVISISGTIYDIGIDNVHIYILSCIFDK